MVKGKRFVKVTYYTLDSDKPVNFIIDKEKIRQYDKAFKKVKK